MSDPSDYLRHDPHAACDRRITTLEAENERLRNALRQQCHCGEFSVPTAWTGPEQGERIPHHCDCVLYGIELPDPARTPIAFADARKAAAALNKEEE